MTKRFLLFALVMFLVGGFSADAFAQPGQTQMTAGAPALTVDKKEHDFGRMKKGADATCIFTVKNTGDQPLIISNCQGSCGCTVPTCDKNPIAPGATSEILVKYDSNRIGAFTKSVTITWNSPDPTRATEIVTIKGEVYE